MMTAIMTYECPAVRSHDRHPLVIWSILHEMLLVPVNLGEIFMEMDSFKSFRDSDTHISIKEDNHAAASDSTPSKLRASLICSAVTPKSSSMSNKVSPAL